MPDASTFAYAAGLHSSPPSVVGNRGAVFARRREPRGEGTHDPIATVSKGVSNATST